MDRPNYPREQAAFNSAAGNASYFIWISLQGERRCVSRGPDSLKQEAKALAQELNASKKMTPEQQAAVVALAQRVEDMKLTRGAKFGPHCYWNRLQPGKKDTYKLKFNPDKLARIMAQADTKVRLEVRNSDGDRRGIDAGKHPQTGFVPHNPRDFTITVKNEGHQATFYRIFTN